MGISVAYCYGDNELRAYMTYTYKGNMLGSRVLESREKLRRGRDQSHVAFRDWSLSLSLPLSLAPDDLSLAPDDGSLSLPWSR